jgi:hypothetical protein
MVSKTYIRRVGSTYVKAERLIFKKFKELYGKSPSQTLVSTIMGTAMLKRSVSVSKKGKKIRIQ